MAELPEHEDPVDAFFARSRTWPALELPSDVVTSLADRVRRTRRRRRFVAASAAAVAVASVGVTTAAVAPRNSPAPAVVSPDGSARPSSPVDISPLPSVTTSGATFVPWQQAFGDAVPAVPSTLADGRGFLLSDVVDSHRVIGLTSEAGQERYGEGTYSLAVVDPTTAKVTKTLDTGDNSASQLANHTDETDLVSHQSVSGDWVGWARGHQGDDEAFSDVTISISNIVTGQRVVLGNVAFGNSSLLMPSLSGDAVVWVDPQALHVYSLSSQKPLYASAVTSTDLTYVKALAWPWLSYVTASGGTDQSGYSTYTYHLVDLRNAADRVVSGPCDGMWCEVVPPGQQSFSTDLTIASQANPAETKVISTGLGGGYFVGMADGFVLWSDGDHGDWLYDTVSGRTVEAPPSQNDVAYLASHYLVWEENPEDPTRSGSMRFADLDVLRLRLANLP